MNLQDRVRLIHATKHKMVMNFAGAGSQALTHLHSVGGSSRTILEATDRYTPSSLIEAVGFKPERFTSKRVAKALAEHAFRRAKHLEQDVNTPLFGLGCTASIATDRKKRGDHRCVVAVKDPFGLMLYELVLTKGKRSRMEEEDVVSMLILKACSDACGILHFPLTQEEPLTEEFNANSDLVSLKDHVNWVKVETNGERSKGKRQTDLAILSGSFNPLHEGHKQLAQTASAFLGKEVCFELSLRNADKSPIDLKEARRRALQFSGYAPFVFSTAALFSDKAVLFPKSTFIVGADTAVRLVETRFYQSEQAMHNAFHVLKENHIRFLVASRKRNGHVKTLQNIAVPDNYKALFTELPQNLFSMDISSTDLRGDLGFTD